MSRLPVTIAGEAFISFYCGTEDGEKVFDRYAEISMFFGRMTNSMTLDITHLKDGLGIDLDKLMKLLAQQELDEKEEAERDAAEWEYQRRRLS